MKYRIAGSFESTRVVEPEHVFNFHDDFVGGLVVTNGMLVSSSEDASVGVFDVETNEHLATLYGHRGPVNFVARGHRPDQVLSAGDDYTARVWDLESRKSVATCEGHSDYVSRVAAAGPDRLVTASRDNRLGVFDSRTGESIAFLEGHSAWIYGLAASPDGKRAVTASLNTQMIVWDLESLSIERWILGEELGDVISVMGMYIGVNNDSGVGHADAINSMVWSSDGARLVSAAKDVIVWSAEDWSELLRFPGDPWGINALALFPDGRRLVGAGRSLKIWDLESGSAVATHPGHGGETIKSVAVSENGRWIFTGDENGEVRKWSVEALLSSTPRPQHTQRAGGVQLSPDGALALTTANDGSAIVWDVETGEAVTTLSHEKIFVEPVGFRGDGAEAVTAAEGAMYRWDAANGELRGSVQCDVGLYGFVGTRLLPDGRHVFAADAIRRPTLWDLDDGTVRPFGGPSCFESKSALTADGKHLLTSSYYTRDSVIEGDELGGDESWKSLEPDLAGANDRCPAHLWDLDTLKLEQSFHVDGSGDPDNKEYASTVALSPDEKTAVVGASKGSVYGFDRHAGARRFKIEAHDEYVSLLFRCGDHFVTSAKDEPLRYWTFDGDAAGELVGTETVTRPATSEDGRWFVAADTETSIGVWDARNRERVGGHEFDAAVASVAVTADASRIVVGLEDGRVAILHVD